MEQKFGLLRDLRRWTHRGPPRLTSGGVDTITQSVIIPDIAVVHPHAEEEIEPMDWGRVILAVAVGAAIVLAGVVLRILLGRRLPLPVRHLIFDGDRGSQSV
ncbi:MAG: hypothetical protein JWO67_3071 [Streptosporangiaceae bacterium]|jgi:hypothetical protein|nr:hypothetical protein [Streptosporangiaceae bacterium]